MHLYSRDVIPATIKKKKKILKSSKMHMKLFQVLFYHGYVP